MLIFSRYTWWVGAMFGLALLLTALSQVGVLNPFQGVFLTVTSPIDNALNAVFEPVASFLADAGDLNSLRDENSRLRVENEDLRNKLTDLQQNAARVTELEQALKITQGDTSQTRLAANVVSRDSSAFSAVVSIDRGASSGIKTGMVVTSAQGTLMGTVTKTFSDHAFVRLVTDTKSKVAAEVQDSKADGIVQGTPERGLTFDLAQADIKVGDTIVTSSLTGRYPAGLPIGRVTEVSGSAQDLYRKVTLEPLVRLSTVTTVLVLTSFTPQFAGVETP